MQRLAVVTGRALGRGMLEFCDMAVESGTSSGVASPRWAPYGLKSVRHGLRQEMKLCWLSVLLVVSMACNAAAQQLELDRRLVEFEMRLEQGDYAQALRVFAELRQQHENDIPKAMWYAHATLCERVGLLEQGLASVDHYLRLTGPSGEHYKDAIRLSIRVTDQLEQAKAQAEAERLASERKATELRRAALAAERIAEAAVELPSDSMGTHGDSPIMVRLPPGRVCLHTGYRARYDGPCREVRVPAFAISKHMVTVAKFRKFLEATRYRTDAERRPRHGCQGYSTPWSTTNSGITWKSHLRSSSDHVPIVCVSVQDADAFARWLSTETGQSYRLPSAAEHHYAFRAGLMVNELDRFWFGNDPHLDAYELIRYVAGDDHYRDDFGSEYRAPPTAYACVLQDDNLHDRSRSLDGKPEPVGTCPPTPSGIVFERMGLRELVHTCVQHRDGNDYDWWFPNSNGGYDELHDCGHVAVIVAGRTEWGDTMPIRTVRRYQGYDSYRTYWNNYTLAGFRVVREVAD